MLSVVACSRAVRVSAVSRTLAAATSDETALVTMQRRRMGFFSELMKNLKKEVDDNELLSETKRKLDERTQAAQERAKGGVSAASSWSKEVSEKLRKEMTEKTERLREALVPPEQPDRKPAEEDAAASSPAATDEQTGREGDEQTDFKSRFAPFTQRLTSSWESVTRLVSPVQQRVQNLTVNIKDNLKDSMPVDTSKIADVKADVARNVNDLTRSVADVGKDVLQSEPVQKLVDTMKSGVDSLSSLQKDRSTVDNPYAHLEGKDRLVDESQPPPDTSSVVVVEQSQLTRDVERLRSAIKSSALYKKAADLKTAVEESDNPLVQNTVDVVDKVVATSARAAKVVVGETEQSRALTALKAVVGPAFSVQKLADDIQNGLGVRFLQAYHSYDLATLAEFCGEGLLLRVSAEAQANRKQGVAVHYYILNFGEVELLQACFVNDQPCLIFVFDIQENMYHTDPAGAVVLNSVDSIQLTRYIWRMVFDEERRMWILAEASQAPPTAMAF